MDDMNDPRENGLRRTALICLLLFAATLVVYWQAGGHDFVDYDDGRYIAENQMVASGLTAHGVARAFTTTHAGNWHPLTWLSHMLDVTLYGMAPRGHHLTNVVLHGFNTVLLFLLLNGLTGACWRSAFAAALFALHPLHVESVAWAAERKDVLSTFLWLLTLLAYARFVRRPARWRYGLALCLFAAGLMAKPMLVTLPFTLLLLDHWPLGRYTSPEGRPSGVRDRIRAMGPLVREKIPFFALAFVSGVITLYAQYQGGAVAALETLPLHSRVLNALAAYTGYIGKMLWPLHLAVIYPLPSTDPVMEGVLSGLALAALTFGAIRAVRRHPFLLTGWLWYLVTLLPVIGLIQVGRQSMADRYTYVPLIGLFVAIAWGGPLIFPRERRRLVFPVATAAVLLACSVLTWRQLGYWRDSAALFSHAAEAVPGNDIARVRLGYALARAGRAPEAMAQYEEALRIRPRDAEAHFNLGFALMEQGRTEEAEAQYREALKTDPGHEGAHVNLGLILAGKGRPGEAVEHYAAALRTNPGNAETHFSLGLLLADGGDLRQGAVHLAEAVRLRPDFAEAHYNLGAALAREGRLEEGMGHFREALRIAPGMKEARLVLETAMRRKGGAAGRGDRG